MFFSLFLYFAVLPSPSYPDLPTSSTGSGKLHHIYNIHIKKKLDVNVDDGDSIYDANYGDEDGDIDDDDDDNDDDDDDGGDDDNIPAFTEFRICLILCSQSLLHDGKHNNMYHFFHQDFQVYLPANQREPLHQMLHCNSISIQIFLSFYLGVLHLEYCFIA